MKFTITNLFLVFTLLSTTAFAEAAKTATSETEQREVMALHHEKMSTCLRSDKSIEECREEMRQSCQYMGENMCMGMGMGMGMGKMDKKSKAGSKSNKK